MKGKVGEPSIPGCPSEYIKFFPRYSDPLKYLIFDSVEGRCRGFGEKSSVVDFLRKALPDVANIDDFESAYLIIALPPNSSFVFDNTISERDIFGILPKFLIANGAKPVSIRSIPELESEPIFKT